jgi:DNA-directed RNA polymerase subunit K/omega
MKVIEDFQDVIADYNPSKNVTTKMITKYELAKVVGLRLEQLARGASTLVTDIDGKASLHDIVRMEIEKHVLPFMIVRTLPSGQKEYWKLADLYIPNIL